MRIYQVAGPLLAAILDSQRIRADVSVNGDGSLSCGLDNSCIDSNSKDPVSGSIDIPPNSSITDFLDPELLDEEVLADIKSNMLAGNLVVIHDAFKAEFAEFVWEQLSRDDLSWQHGQYLHPEGSVAYIPFDNQVGEELEGEKFEILRQKVKFIKREHRSNIKPGFNPEHAGHNTRKKELRDLPKELEDVMAIFNNTSTKDFMTSISGRSCSGEADFIPTEYGPRDYAGPHTDFKGLRSVDFEWTLVKDWSQYWGGAFWWGDSNSMKEGWLTPKFNTLILFLPTMISTHYVTPVNQPAKSRRLSISGKFNSRMGDAFNVEEPIERLYEDKQNHIRLTSDEAVWFAHELNPETYTNDPHRQQSIRDVQQSINNTYLYPEYDSIFLISWDDKQDNKPEEPILEEILITAESSILDFLNPNVLEDPELISEIGTKLKEGKMVMIREAFKAEFAEYAWKHMNRDDVVWAGKSANYDHDTPYDVQKRYISAELKKVLGVFDHEKSVKFIESISGRSCSGELNHQGATWYKQGSYAPPHTDFRNQDSVTLNWDLSKNWDATFGGSFYWFPSKTMNGGYNVRSFNTLMWFLPTPTSSHAIIPVSWWAESKLHYIAAIYSSDNKDFEASIENNRLEEDYANEEDYIKLHNEQARFIVHEMQPREMTDDPVKMRKLFMLKRNVAKKYLYSWGKTFVLESEED